MDPRKSICPAPPLVSRGTIDPLRRKECADPGSTITMIDRLTYRWASISHDVISACPGLDKDSDNPAFRGAVIRARFRAAVGLKRREEPEDVTWRDRAADTGGERPIHWDLSYRIIPRRIWPAVLADSGNSK